MFLRNSQNQNIQNMYMQVKINFSIIPKDVKNHHIDKYHKYYITDNKNFFYFTLLFIKKKQSDKIISIPNDQSSIEFISYLTCQYRRLFSFSLNELITNERDYSIIINYFILSNPHKGNALAPKNEYDEK